MTAGQGLSKYKVDQRSDKVLLKGMHKVLQGAQGALRCTRCSTRRRTKCSKVPRVLHKEMHKVLQGAQGAPQGDTQSVLLTKTRHQELSSGGSVDQDLLDLQHTRLQVLP